jgi:hypothetical protein
MYSAFGVDHHGAEISKKVLPFGSKGGKLAGAKVKLRGLTQSGVDSLRTAAKDTLSDPKNAKVPLRDAKTPFVDSLSTNSRFHGAIQAAREVGARQAKAATEGKSTSILDNATIGDVSRAAEVRRIDRSPENILRGEKKVTTSTNALTGQTKKHVERKGNKFFKAKDVTYINGESYADKGMNGGLTDAGKVTLVGGPAAAAGLGGIAMNEKRKRSSY